MPRYNLLIILYKCITNCQYIDLIFLFKKLTRKFVLQIYGLIFCISIVACGNAMPSIQKNMQDNMKSNMILSYRKVVKQKTADEK